MFTTARGVSRRLLIRRDEMYVVLDGERLEGFWISLGDSTIASDGTSAIVDVAERGGGFSPFLVCPLSPELVRKVEDPNVPVRYVLIVRDPDTGIQLADFSDEPIRGESFWRTVEGSYRSGAWRRDLRY
jgi:hypothetical protein